VNDADVVVLSVVELGSFVLCRGDEFIVLFSSATIVVSSLVLKVTTLIVVGVTELVCAVVDFLVVVFVVVDKD